MTNIQRVALCIDQCEHPERIKSALELLLKPPNYTDVSVICEQMLVMETNQKNIAREEQRWQPV